jgi:deoxyribodipyrimidine photo-lyase
MNRLPELVDDYEEARDRMDLDGTSRLSADLKFGTVSPREVWNKCGDKKTAEPFRTELIWREFNYDVAATRPHVLTEPFRSAWRGFPWRDDEKGWKAWVDGKTGYPVVDASARQLLAEGFVHNRARMISASFLTKHLLVEYSRGEEHYFNHLIDGDAAQNNAGWQWSAGCGCDAQPWFRIFNPMTQGKRFDPEGHYVRRWVPELADMPARWIHAPWEAPEEVLEKAGVKLGTDYPEPVVDHKEARERFLAAAKSHLD